jgi:hypothetical protein
VIAAEQVDEDEPGDARLPADGAVGDQFAVAAKVDSGEHCPQLGGGTEGSAVVAEVVDGLADRRGDVPGAPRWLHAARRPESLAPVLLKAADVDDRGARCADGVTHRGMVGAQPLVLPGQRVAGDGRLGPVRLRFARDAAAMIGLPPPESFAVPGDRAAAAGAVRAFRAAQRG